MSFKPIVTPPEMAVERDSAALNTSLDDLVDDVQSAPQSPAESNVNLDLSQAREMGVDKKPAEKPEPTPEEEAQAKFEEIDRKDKIRAELEKILRKARSEKFKERPDARALANAFLMEICGIERFKHDYALVGKTIQVVFHTPTEEQVRDIGKQMVRDSIAKRSVYMPENEIDAVCYRLAMSLASIRITNPASQEVNEYRIDAVPMSELDSTKLGCLPTDLEPRRRWLYLTQNVLKTQFLTSQVTGAYDSFELLVAELVTLANEDPDFFSMESSAAG